MHADLDTLVTALYVTIDDRFGPRLGPGRKPKLSVAELVCLAVAQVLLGFESTFDTLKDQLGLERHGGRTLAGLYGRIAQRLLALAAAIWWNWQSGQPHKRSLVAYDH